MTHLVLVTAIPAILKMIKEEFAHLAIKNAPHVVPLLSIVNPVLKVILKIQMIVQTV